MAAASMNRAGYVRLMAARAMVTTPSSIGWRSTSSTFLRNSGSSSRNSTPPWARLTSPGRGYEPPPINPASEIVWCGARNGRRATSDSPTGSTPATEWIFVVSSASSRLIFGRMVGSRRASIVFPDPGGPIIRMLCPPAAATSSARLACACPFTSAKSTSSFARSANSAARSTCASGSVPRPSRKSASSERFAAPSTRTPETTPASGRLSRGSTSASSPAARRERHRQRAAHRPDRPLKPQLTEHRHPPQPLRRDLFRGGEDPDRDRQVEGAAVLADVGRGEVHGDALQGERIARVRERGVHPLATLLHGSLRQPHGSEGGEAA